MFKYLRASKKHPFETHASFHVSASRKNKKHHCQVLVSRPGTSGGWQECVLNRFVDVNPEYPLRFVQFTNLLIPGLVNSSPQNLGNFQFH